MTEEYVSLARKIMEEFADSTGLSSTEKPARRYLWTDAFAVCNFLGLFRQTGEKRYLRLASNLVDQVHRILGRHRSDDHREGWISGLGEREGEIHPTAGGLRIGKKLSERKPEEPFDDRLEWERDGQYYHYLTRWMHALSRTGQVTGVPQYHHWAVELAKTAHARFVYPPVRGGPKRMCWKMSIDLSYPLVESMGHHDPLDGLVTYQWLQAVASQDLGQHLSSEIDEMTSICREKNWTTNDPLGLGGLLTDAFRVAQLTAVGKFSPEDLLENLIDATLQGLAPYAKQAPLELPAHYRLAFRELGLSIGLHAVSGIQEAIDKAPERFVNRGRLRSMVEALAGYFPMGESIERFWLDPANRQSESWTAHRDINMVMLATSLVPDGYLAPNSG